MYGQENRAEDQANQQRVEAIAAEENDCRIESEYQGSFLVDDRYVSLWSAWDKDGDDGCDIWGYVVDGEEIISYTDAGRLGIMFPATTETAGFLRDGTWSERARFGR